jgi:hypothetical protein
MSTLNDVYQKFGEVSEAAQLLETELGTLLLSIRADEHALFSGGNPELAADRCKHDPTWTALLSDERAARTRFEDERITNETKCRAHRQKVNRFMEFFVQNGNFKLI